MSERKRPRPGRCMLCRQSVDYTVHRKCPNCREDLMFGRYAKKGKLHKFVRKK